MAPASYRLKKISGKGQDLKATRNIQRGDLIIEERPLIVISDGPDQSKNEENMVDAVTQLSHVQKWSFMNLVVADTTAVELAMDINSATCSKEEAQAIVDRFHTNAFGGPNENGDDLNILALEASRINHSCAPNSHLSYDHSTRNFQVRAITDIDRGAEITGSYINLRYGRDIRMLRLESAYGFTCDCEACNLGGSSSQHAKASDRRRRRVHIYEKMLVSASKSTHWEKNRKCI